MANVYFSHELIREKINSMLDTKVSMSQFMHSDDSLTAEAGMKIKVQKYVANDNIKDVAEGEGNEDFSEVDYTEDEYGSSSDGEFLPCEDCHNSRFECI